MSGAAGHGPGTAATPHRADDAGPPDDGGPLDEPGIDRARGAAARASAYALYALAFAPPCEELRRAVRDHAGPFALPPPEPDALVVEHTRLFVGPGRAPAPPYGSVYHDGRVLMGESTMDVLRHYREAGYAFAPDAGILPDHVVAELSFLSVLAEEEARAWSEGAEGSARLWAGRRGAFLCDHLGAWAPELCRRMLAATPAPFYRALAVNLRQLVAGDLEELVRAVGAADAQEADAREADAREADAREADAREADARGALS